MDVRRGARPSLEAFDPHSAPVVQVDTDMAAVPRERLTPQALRQRFGAHVQWEPEVRREPRFVDRIATPAAVLVPLIERPAGLTVLLTERSPALSSHPGQVSFPGGRVDATDADAPHAALREAREEVGLAPEYVSVLGELPLYVTGTQFEVTPVVGLVRTGFALRVNSDEVADAFEVPLAYLMDPAHHRHHQTWRDGQLRRWLSMPYVAPSDIRIGWAGRERERFIWGATAGMLRNLYRFLSA